MTGTYSTIDGCIYEVFFDKITEFTGKGKKSTHSQLMAKCIKSKVERKCEPFNIIPGQIERNLLFGSWIKQE